MTKQFIPLQFTSLAVEQEIRGICAVHGIPMAALEESILQDYVLIQPGTVEPERMKSGPKRMLENPSKLLNVACFAWLEGFTRGQASLGVGKAIRPTFDVTKPSPAIEKMERQNAFIRMGGEHFLAPSPDRELTKQS